MELYAEVVIDVNNKNVDRLFTYKISKKDVSFAEVGKRCIVPFGVGNKEIFAMIVKIKHEIDFDKNKCKNITKIIDKEPIISRELLNLTYLMSKKYYCTFNECIKLCIPKKATLQNEYVLSINIDSDYSSYKNNYIEIIDFILNHNNKVIYEEVLETFQNSKNKISKLKTDGILTMKNISEVKEVTQKVTYVYINYDNENIDKDLNIIISKKNKQSLVLEFLLENNDVALKDILQILKITKSPINTLVKNNILFFEQVEVLRNPIKSGTYKGNKIKEHTEEQKKAIELICNNIKSNVFEKATLLHGVTGSGKTEIYINIVEKVLSQNQEAIILVPEISLTGQLVDIFTSYFGDLVTVTHSKLSLGERYDQWKRTKESSAKIVIGPRSALFTPFENLGVIIIDEEHDSSFKSDVTPKYSAREVAIMRGKISNCQVILGSATPKIESYYKALNDEYNLIELKNRVNKKLPTVHIADLREELAEGNKSIFSSKLLELMVEAINKDEQVILFLNKRGYSSFVNCRTCGEVIKCPDCDVSMTYHSYNNTLQCHYCNRKKKSPDKCPICGSKHIRHFGIGTQKIAEEVMKIFPDEKVIRMDQDTTKTKNSHEELIKEFRLKKARFLVGTQMIAKGLDFSDVTVVGIVASDLSLNMNEYLSSEITFSLLTQVAGRAGRSEKDGNVVIQSYKPEHYAIELAKTNNYKEFYQNEIAYRRLSNNPPFCNNFYIYGTALDEKKLIKTLYKLVDFMVQYRDEILIKTTKDDLFFEIIGPAPAVISKVRRRYRWRILVKGNYESELIFLVTRAVELLKTEVNCIDINISLNLNPESII